MPVVDHVMVVVMGGMEEVEVNMAEVVEGMTAVVVGMVADAADMTVGKDVADMDVRTALKLLLHSQ